MHVDVTALSHDQLAALYLQRESEIADQQKQFNEQQKQLNEHHLKELTARDEQIRVLSEKLLEKQHFIEQLRRMRYGVTSERFIVPDGQVVLPFVVDTERVGAAVGKALKSVVAEHTRAAKKHHPGRQPLPEHLPVEEILLEPDEDVTGLKCIGVEIIDELVYQPGRFYIRRYKRLKYVKPEDENLDQKVIIASKPVRPIDKCEASAELLATITIDKHVYHLPVYRQLERFKALDVEIHRSTADNWQRLTGLLLRPLYAALESLVLQSSYLQVDETGLKVQDRDKKGSTHRGMIWAYHAPVDKLMYFDYQRGRGKVNCKQMLEQFSGYLQTDGYAAYNVHKARADITPLACWAHVRRKFFDAQSNDQERSEIALKLIRKLYDIERHARDEQLTAEQRKTLRLDQSLPIVNAIGQWLASEIEHTTPRSPIGGAIRYAVSLWKELEDYLIDGNLEIDNNLVENAIRPIALGRKNYLFAGSHDAAVNIAMYRSFFATCRLNGIDPHRWLLHVLNAIRITPTNEYHTLLPQNVDPDLFASNLPPAR